LCFLHPEIAHPLKFQKKKKPQKAKMQVESPTLQSAADSFYNAQVAIISVVVASCNPPPLKTIKLKT
jgi:hypothetical protein